MVGQTGGMGNPTLRVRWRGMITLAGCEAYARVWGTTTWLKRR